MSKTKPTQPPTQPAKADLPEGWAVATIGDVTVPKVDQSGPGEGQEFTYIDIASVDNERKSIIAPRVLPTQGAPSRARQVARFGDVLVSMTRPNLNAVALVGPELDGAIASTGFDVLHSIESLPGWLFLVVRGEAFIESMTALVQGALYPAVRPRDVRGFEFPLPPLPEQKRIVAKVETLLERVNAARARLAKLPAIIKRFRQSVLAAACSGQLTAEWRTEHPDAVGEAGFLRDSGKEIFEENRLEVPDSWKRLPAADLFDWSSGKNLPARAMRPGLHPVYGGNGISGWHDRYLVEDPTIVIGRVGALCGNVYLTGPKAWVTDNAIFAKAVASSVDVAFAQIVFKNAELNTRSGGTGQPFVNQQILDAVGFPLPPLPEQHEIVRRVEALFALFARIESHVREATVRAKRLPQAILERAFRGELVATEAELAAKEGRDFEPASALLEKIQETRKQHKPDKRGRGGKQMTRRSTGRQAVKKRRAIDEVLREHGKPLTPERLFDLAGFDEDSVDGFFEQSRKLIHEGKVRENRPNKKDVTLEAVGT